MGVCDNAIINELIPISVSPKKSIIFANSKCAALDVDFNREKRVCTVNSTFGEDIEISLNGDVDDCYIQYHPIVDEKTNFTYSPVLTADKKGKNAQFITEIRINQ